MIRAERLILARATHLDSLAARLAEPRVRRIVLLLLAGDLVQLDPYDDDLAYACDLGLVTPKDPVRIDLLIRWPYINENGKRHWQREALELKVWHPDKADPLRQGMTQLDRYLDRLGLDTGILIIFDRRSDAPDLSERTQFDIATTQTGRTVTVLRA
ncbi:hypothetical protein [Frankia sp. Cr2]|uniref:hypothetical protein n=1 Tax=Frankia sp. Cr2 TaxID=3073932 RepID=UPI002AD2CFBC|nr:hypothetical protein [Frankia sp. Cr2]